MRLLRAHQIEAAGLADGQYALEVLDSKVAGLTTVSAGGGGGWNHPVTLPLSTLTGWTAGAGTWAISSGVIRQSVTTNQVNRLHLDTKFPLAHCIVEVDVKLDITPNNVSSRGGIVFGTPATADGANGHEISLLTSGSTTQATAVDFEQDATINFGNVALAAPIPNGTWTTMRMHKVGPHYDVWINGTFLTSFQMGINTSGASTGRRLGRLALYSYASDVSFRNLDVWTPTFP